MAEAHNYLKLFENRTNITMTDEEIARLMNFDMSVGHSDMTYNRRLLEYYLMGIGALCFCAFGMAANIMSVIILTRRIMNSSTYSYLTALSVCDFLFLVCTMLIYMDDTAMPKKEDEIWEHSKMYSHLFPVIHPLALVFQVTSIWLTMAFTIDRYIMICHPFKAEAMCNRSIARKVIVGICVSGILFNIPRFFEYHTVKVPTLNGTTRLSPDLTDIGRDDIFRELVHQWLYLIFVCGTPMICLIILNGFLIFAVHKSKRRGRQINAAERRRNDTTVMLIGVVVIFIICQLPALIANVIFATNPKATFSFPYIVFQEIGNFLVIINSAINIVPYYFFGKKFRKQFYRIFCGCFLKRELRLSFTRSTSLSVFERRGSEYSNSINTILTIPNGKSASKRSIFEKVTMNCPCTSEDGIGPVGNRDHKNSIPDSEFSVNIPLTIVCNKDTDGDRLSSDHSDKNIEKEAGDETTSLCKEDTISPDSDQVSFIDKEQLTSTNTEDRETTIEHCHNNNIRKNAEALNPEEILHLFPSSNKDTNEIEPDLSAEHI